MNITNALLSFIQPKLFVQSNIIKHINDRLDVWEAIGYYPVSETFINSFSSQYPIDVNVLFFNEKIVINSYYKNLKVISIKYDRKGEKISRLHIGMLRKENDDVQQLLSKIRRIANLPNRAV